MSLVACSIIKGYEKLSISQGVFALCRKPVKPSNILSNYFLIAIDDMPVVNIYLYFYRPGLVGIAFHVVIHKYLRVIIHSHRLVACTSVKLKISECSVVMFVHE